MAFGDTVQSGSVGTSTSGDASASCAAATAGNLLVAVVARSATGLGSAWGAVSGWDLLHSSPADSGNLCASIWGKIAAGGETSFTTSMTTPSGNWTCQIHEFEGPFDVSFNDAAAGSENESFLSSTTATISTGTGGTTSSASSLALAFFAVDQGLNFGTRSYTNSFTEVAAATSGARAGGVLAKRVLTTTGAHETTLSYSSGGGADEMYAALVIAKAASTGSRPTVVLDTLDAHEFSTSTPTLQFTATDADGDDVEIELEIADNANFTSATASLAHEFAPGTGLGSLSIHGTPSSGTSSTGQVQIDDRASQSFLAIGGKVVKGSFQMGRDDYSPSGNAYQRIYAHTGTFGSSSAPVGGNAPTTSPALGWLAQSDAKPLDGTMANTQAWHDFDFSGDAQIHLTPGTHYMLALEWEPDSTATDNGFSITGDAMGNGTPGAADPGNLYNDGSNSGLGGVQATWDLYYRIYLDLMSSTFSSTTDAGFANQDNGGDTHPFTSGDQHAYTVQSALANGTYYWRVRASDSEGAGDWSETRSFVVEALEISDGSSAGTSAVSAVGSALVSAAGTIAGAATALAVGAAFVAATGSAAGSATVSATSSTIVAVTAAGTSTAAAVGSSVATATATAAGTSTSAATGSSLATATGTADGTSSASATAAETSTGTAAGTSTATAAGTSLVTADGTAAGTSTASAVSGVQSTGTAAGTSTAAATGSSLADADGTASGTSTAGATASSLVTATATAAGTSTAAATGSSLADSDGASAGTSTASAVGSTAEDVIPDVIVLSGATWATPSLTVATFFVPTIAETWDAPAISDQSFTPTL